jgi:chemotaxis protein MotB
MLSKNHRTERPTSAASWRSWPGVLGVWLLLALTGCVSQARYDDALTRVEGDAARIRSLDARIASCQQEALRARSQADHETLELQDALDRETASAHELRKRLEELGQDVDKLLVDKGALSVNLQITKVKLAALRRAEAAAKARAALYRDLALKLKAMIDAGDLRVVLRDGRMTLALPNDVLFDSGQIDIKPKGRDALKQVAGVLRTLGERHLQVAGHTDNVPISTARFPSNWELSSGRALEVTRFLIGQGLRSEALSAAAYGEFDPVAGNDSPEGRTKNRRIEITLMPGIDELVALPDEG